MNDEDLELFTEATPLYKQYPNLATDADTRNVNLANTRFPNGIMHQNPVPLSSGHQIHKNINIEMTQSEQVHNLLTSIASVEAMLVSLKNSVMELTSAINPVKHEKRTLKTKQ